MGEEFGDDISQLRMKTTNSQFREQSRMANDGYGAYSWGTVYKNKDDILPGYVERPVHAVVDPYVSRIGQGYGAKGISTFEGQPIWSSWSNDTQPAEGTPGIPGTPSAPMSLAQQMTGQSSKYGTAAGWGRSGMTNDSTHLGQYVTRISGMTGNKVTRLGPPPPPNYVAGTLSTAIKKPKQPSLTITAARSPMTDGSPFGIPRMRPADHSYYLGQPRNRRPCSQYMPMSNGDTWQRY